MNGFGTHNWWLAFRGWLGAKLRGEPVIWETKKSPYTYDYHVVTIGKDALKERK